VGWSQNEGVGRGKPSEKAGKADAALGSRESACSQASGRTTWKRRAIEEVPAEEGEGRLERETYFGNSKKNMEKRKTLGEKAIIETLKSTAQRAGATLGEAPRAKRNQPKCALSIIVESENMKGSTAEDRGKTKQQRPKCKF